MEEWETFLGLLATVLKWILPEWGGFDSIMDGEFCNRGDEA